MKLEIILMGIAVVVAIVALLSSKFVRVVCQEAIFHPRYHCKIQVHSEGVSIKRAETKQKLEG